MKLYTVLILSNKIRWLEINFVHQYHSFELELNPEGG